MFKIALNLHKPYNYAFFCPVSKLHLTVSNPVGFVHEVTPAISRGLRNNTLIDVDGITEKPKETEQKPANPPQNPPETPPEVPSDVSVNNDTNKKKRGRRAAVAAPTEDIPNDLFDNIQ